MASATAFEILNTNVRFNELYLNIRVDADSDATEHGAAKGPSLAKVYEAVFGDNFRSQKIKVSTSDEISTLNLFPKCLILPL